MKRGKAIGLLVVVGLLLQLPQGARGDRLVNDVVVPEDTEFLLELLSPISTETNKKGDQFTCVVREPRNFAGAYVTGHITKLKSSGKVKGNSELAFAFETITMPDERTGKFYAQIVEVYEVTGVGKEGRADEEGTVKGKSRRKSDAVKIGTGAVVGAIIGGILGGGKGAAAGAAIGAGVATTTTLATKGPNLKFDQGTQFKVRTAGRTRN